MKLWKAILKGSKIRGQGFGSFFPRGKSCALGAAIEGGFFVNTIDDVMLDRMRRIGLYASMITRKQGCPACQHSSKAMIPHLNDHHNWSREAIAEYVKTKEDAITHKKWDTRKIARYARVIETEQDLIPQTKENDVCQLSKPILR